MTQIIREGPKRLSKYSGRSSKVLKYWKPEKILFILWTRSEIQEQLKDIHVMISHGSWTRCCVFSDLFQTNAHCSCSRELGLFRTLNPDLKESPGYQYIKDDDPGCQYSSNECRTWFEDTWFNGINCFKTVQHSYKYWTSFVLPSAAPREMLTSHTFIMSTARNCEGRPYQSRFCINLGRLFLKGAFSTSRFLVQPQVPHTWKLHLPHRFQITQNKT